MQRFWSSIAVQLGKHAIWVTLIGLVATVGLGLGITQLKFATGQDSYLNTNEAVYKDNVVYQGLFGGQAMLTVVSMDPGHTIDELFTGDGARQLRDFHDTLEASGQVKEVVSPLTILRFSDSLVSSPDGNPTDSPAAKALLAAQAKEKPGSPAAAAWAKDSVATLSRLTAIPAAERTFDNPEWVKFLLYNNEGRVRKALSSVFLDDHTAQIVTRLPGNASIETEGKAATLVQQEAAKLHFANATTVTTGAAVLLKDINDYLRGGMLTLGGIAVLIMVLILLVLFQVRWRLLPLLVVLVGVIWAFGLAGYLGIPLTIVTIAGLPVMLGIGIDYAIQMHARVEEEVVIDRSEHPIQESARNLGPALLVVTFDAIFAFAALHFAKVPMLRDFGLLLAVGIAAICIGSIILPLAILGIREFKSPTTGRDFRSGPLGRLVVWLGSVSPRAAILLAVASIGIFIGGIAVEDKLTLQTDPVQWVNQDSQVIKDINKVERQAGGSSELGVFATSKNVFSDEFATFAHDFTRDTLRKYPNKLLTGSSIETAIGDIVNDVPGGSDIAPRGEDVRNAFDVAPSDVRALDGQQRRSGVQHHLPHRSGFARGACAGRAGHPRRHPSAAGDHRDAVGSRGRRRGIARQPRGEPDRADLPRDPLRVPLPRGAAALVHPCTAVAGAGADRGRHLVARRVRVQHRVEPDDRGGWSARRRRVHGVHVAHPVAIRGGTPAGLRAARGDRSRRVPHGARLRGVRADRDRRGRGPVVLVATAPA